MDIQEIIDLLEKAIAEYDGPRIKFYYANANAKYYVAEQKLFDQALTLLNQQSKALNSCPYPPCKGEGKLQQNAGIYYVYCINCGRHTDSFEKDADAITAWNNTNKPEQPKATSIGNKIREIASKDILGQTKLVRDKDILNQAADRLDAWWKYINELKEEVDLLKQQPTAGEFTKKFNGLIEEIKSMFTVSQAMAKNSFDSTTFPIEGETYNPNPPPETSLKLKQQPIEYPNSEFTKVQRAAVQCAIDAYEQDEEWCPTKMSRLLEACDRLDRAEAINKDLLKACEYSHRLLLRNIGQSTHAVALLEAAIAKARKGIKRDGTPSP